MHCERSRIWSLSSLHIDRSLPWMFFHSGVLFHAAAKKHSEAENVARCRTVAGSRFVCCMGPSADKGGQAGHQ